MSEYKFSAAEVLGSARTTSTGDYFIIVNSATAGEPGTFISLNKYTFDQFAAGNYDSITFVDNGMMPKTKDKNGIERPDTKATKIKEGGIEYAARALKIKNIDEANLDYQLKEIHKKTADLGDVA